MNATRRAAINKLIGRLEDAQSELETIREEIQALADEERDAFEGLPENLQAGDRGMAMESAADSLEEAASSCAELDQVISELESARDAC